MKMDFAVIGGTGLYCLSDGQAGDSIAVETRYGAMEVERGRVGEVEVGFLARHGKGHGVPPHRVNYRGNIAALRELGVGSILASAAVGSISEDLPPGSLVVLTQFLDFTRARAGTFFDGEEEEVRHVDMTDPYCGHLRAELLGAAEALGEKVHPEGVYVCTEGPRFETPAEIEMFGRLGGDVVGMTSVPEVVLAREAGICYAGLAIVTNWAAGVSKEPLRHEEVSAFMGVQMPRVRALFEEVVKGHKEIAGTAQARCSCRPCREG